MDFDALHALETIENIQPAAPAGALKVILGIGDVVQLAQHEIGDVEGAINESGAHDVGDPAINDDIGVEDLGGAADGRAMHPRRLLGDGREDVRDLLLGAHGETNPEHHARHAGKDGDGQAVAGKAREGERHQDGQTQPGDGTDQSHDLVEQGHLLEGADPGHQLAEKEDREEEADQPAGRRDAHAKEIRVGLGGLEVRREQQRLEALSDQIAQQDANENYRGNE